MKINKKMSNKSRSNRYSKLKRRRCTKNLIEYLYDRSVRGSSNDSSRFANKLFDSAKDFYKKDLTAHFGCVNAIEFSADGNLLFSGGDDRRVLMWNTNDAMMYGTGKSGDGAKPNVMKCSHYSNIFCLAVDDGNKRVLSGSNDDQVIVHDYATGSPIDVFSHDSPVFSLSLHPSNGNIFASAADNGRIAIYDIRESNTDLFCLAKLRTPFHGVMFNPVEPSFIATANSKVGIHIWDLRKPGEILLKCNDEPSMAVRWNRHGTTLLALRNLLPVVLYDPIDLRRKVEFDSGTYFNACTMKSCCFAGPNDEYILSGSDDFNLYMWKVPEPWPEDGWVGSEYLALSGHRSIVNQVRFATSKYLIATSGVEKIIKIWSPFRMPYSEGDRDKASSKRHRVLCSSKFCTRSPGSLSHDYSQESVEEDARMIHFFDSLLQNELDYVPETFCPDSNIFSESGRKKGTVMYEKLIRKKIKYLSKILIEKSKDGASYCSIKESGNGVTPAKGTERNPSRNAEASPGPTTGDRPLGDPDSSATSAFDSPGSSRSTDLDFPRFFPTGISPTNSESGKSKLVKEKLKSKNLSATTTTTTTSSSRRELSETSDSESDQCQSGKFIKRKRVNATRCYRSHAKNNNKSGESESSDSSDSDIRTKNVNGAKEISSRKRVKCGLLDNIEPRGQ